MFYSKWSVTRALKLPFLPASLRFFSTSLPFWSDAEGERTSSYGVIPCPHGHLSGARARSRSRASQAVWGLMLSFLGKFYKENYFALI